MKRGQVTVWVIIGMLLVASILLFVFLQKDPTVEVQQDEIELSSFISSCIEKEIPDALDIMLPRGGLLEKHGTVTYNREEIEYLCVNLGFYETCVNQHPLLIQEMEDDLENYLKPKADVCFSELYDHVENLGGELSLETSYEFEVSVVPDRVLINIERDTTYQNQVGEVAEINDYSAEHESGAHGLATVALEIAAQESDYCYFESIGYSLYYPRYKVTRNQLSYPVKIYTINDTLTNEYMRIAIRSCAMPAGF